MKDFLDFATNPKNSPCYVHCEAGKGRTGVASACYRMAVEGWPPEKAIAEGMRTLRDDGWIKVLNGATTVEEVLRVSEENE